MDKIAIISDIHGNLEALTTVLKNIQDKGIKNIYCLGDTISKVTHVHECLELIKTHCSIVLQGNCEYYFSQDIDLKTKSPSEVQSILWNKSKLTNEDNEYIKSLPYCYEFYISGRLVRMFHAHPKIINKNIGNIESPSRFYELFLPSENTTSNKVADIVIYGHIHTPYMQKIYNRIIINTGSVGNSIDVYRNEQKDGNIQNTTMASYVIISGFLGSKDFCDFSYEFVNLPYNITKELESNTDNIEFNEYKEEIENGKYRDMDRIYQYFDSIGIDKNSI